MMIILVWAIIVVLGHFCGLATILLFSTYMVLSHYFGTWVLLWFWPLLCYFATIKPLFWYLGTLWFWAVLFYFVTNMVLSHYFGTWALCGSDHYYVILPLIRWLAIILVLGYYCDFQGIKYMVIFVTGTIVSPSFVSTTIESAIKVSINIFLLLYFLIRKFLKILFLEVRKNQDFVLNKQA